MNPHTPLAGNSPVGYEDSRRIVDVEQVMVDGLVHVKDQFGQNMEVRCNLMPTRGPWPRPGERWVIDRSLGSWNFVAIATMEDPGEPIPPGVTEDLHYRHVQSSASSVWTINHNLGKRPSVEITDSAGTQMMAPVKWTSDNQIVITFSAPTSGVAYLN